MGRPRLTADQVRKWADFAESSPLYQRLAGVVAADPDLMRVVNRVENLPQLNILFAGVQYLMTRDGGGQLESFYPNFTSPSLDEIGVAEPFREFVLANEEELVEIGRTRYTQTNECRRCAVLLPGIWATPLERFHLVDLGTSAGLNLHLDRYRYRWGGITWGPESPVVLETDMRGRPIEPHAIGVLSRTGIDLAPIDPANEEDRRWLEALTWPEQTDRLRRLSSALDLARRLEARLIAGDVVEILGPVLDELPDRDPVIVTNSFVFNQLTPENRTILESIIDEMRHTRPVYRVSLEWLDEERPGASLEVFGPDGPATIGLAHPHGEWLDLQ